MLLVVVEEPLCDRSEFFGDLASRIGFDDPALEAFGENRGPVDLGEFGVFRNEFAEVQLVE